MIGWYGTHAGSSKLRSQAAEYASEVEGNLAGSGRMEKGAKNQAATQAVVGQRLLWAS